MKLLVSACLLGVGCRYDGGHNQLPQLKELLKTHTCIPICLEQMGACPPPCPPAERQGIRWSPGTGKTSPRPSSGVRRRSSAWPTSTGARPPC